MSGVNQLGQPTGAATPIAPATGNSYVQRAIDVTLSLGEGSFGDAGFNTVKLSGLRVACTIKKLGFPGMGTANVRVYGVAPDVMNRVSTLGVPVTMSRLNDCTIAVGDVGAGTSVVFNGQILNAWQELDAQPDTSLVIDLIASFYVAMQPAPPVSYAGATDVASAMSGIATRIGRGFHNNGVQAKLSNQYLAGTPLQQAQTLARNANVEFYDDGQTFWIWPKVGMRTTSAAPLISPETGLVGYPKYQSQGMRFRCLFNPSIDFGNQIVMRSSLTAANGTWYVNDLSYDLAAQVPGGPWFCDVGCVRLPGTPAA